MMTYETLAIKQQGDLTLRLQRVMGARSYQHRIDICINHRWFLLTKFGGYNNERMIKKFLELDF